VATSLIVTGCGESAAECEARRRVIDAQIDYLKNMSDAEYATANPYYTLRLARIFKSQEIGELVRSRMCGY